MSRSRINFQQIFFRQKKMLEVGRSADSSTNKVMAILTILSWPALVAFTKYTLDSDAVEHHERASQVNKNFPYMNNPTGIQYTWGTPCNFLDFECYRDFRKKKYGFEDGYVARDFLFANKEH